MGVLDQLRVRVMFFVENAVDKKHVVAAVVEACVENDYQIAGRNVFEFNRPAVFFVREGLDADVFNGADSREEFAERIFDVWK